MEGIRWITETQTGQGRPVYNRERKREREREREWENPRVWVKRPSPAFSDLRPGRRPYCRSLFHSILFVVVRIHVSTSPSWNVQKSDAILISRCGFMNKISGLSDVGTGQPVWTAACRNSKVEKGCTRVPGDHAKWRCPWRVDSHCHGDTLVCTRGVRRVHTSVYGYTCRYTRGCADKSTRGRVCG